MGTLEEYDGFDLDVQDEEGKEYMLTLTAKNLAFKYVFSRKRLLRLRDLLNLLES